MKQSETKIIKRSEINLNPYNPKRHTDEQVKLQKKNLRKVGFLGGVVFNETTGNLLDGHRRIKALDQINHYDGTPETDYDIKVEATQLSETDEKNQLVYMAIGNTKADYNLIAPYANDIDYTEVGLTSEQYNEILALRPNESLEAIPTWDEDFITPVTELEVKERTNEEVQEEIQNKPSMTKEQVKKEKEKCGDVAGNRQEEQDLYAIINFSDKEQKLAFCELLGIDNSMFLNLKGQVVNDLLSRL